MSTERDALQDRRVAVDAKHFRAAQAASISMVAEAKTTILLHHYDKVLREVRQHLDSLGAHYRTDESGNLVGRVRIEVEVLAYPKPDGVDAKWFREQVGYVSPHHYGQPIMFDLPDEETL